MKELIFRNKDKMPALGLGTWQSSRDEVKQAVLEAIRNGYRHIDCAAIYGNEDVIGEALSEIFKEGVVKREDLWITSKLWNNSHEPIYVEQALRQTLHDLQLDYLDLYLIHWPVSLIHSVKMPTQPSDFINPPVPTIDTWRAMEDVCKKGLTKHIGVSNFNIKRLKALQEEASIQPELNQVELHPYLAQKELVNYCNQNNILLTAYSPLGRGFRDKASKEALLDNSTITLIAGKYEVNPAEVVLAWGMHRGYAVIPKSVNAQRIRSNFQATHLELTEEELAAIDSLDQNLRLTLGEIWCMDGSPYTQESLWG